MHLALLWHFHQPDYRDPRTGVPVMPWVRLHALRGYRDLPIELVEQEVSATVNIVPSLLDQLLHYADGGSDPHLDLTRREADSLDSEEIEQIRRTFVAGNAVMIEAHPAWRTLAHRVRAGERLSTERLRDLQVWSTLAWFGATALRDFPELLALQQKGRSFSEDDKESMIAVQRRILTELPGVLRTLATGSAAAVSASAYFHPILPLLVDCRHARRCMPGLPDECRFAWPDDARLQLDRGRRRLGEVLGKLPVGLWPSEGSVSPEVAAIAAEVGFKWLATDEGILLRSQADAAARPGGWDLGAGLRGFFRDQDLSDRIGFSYGRRPPRDAVRELLHEVERRARGGVVVVALDGENPWEGFPDAGRAFREALHAGLRTGPVRGLTLDAAAELPPVGRVHRLHTGSWIHADFGIWIGHPEDRAAWRLLEQARLAIDQEPDLNRRSEALEKLLPAEGSDWMWWYGEEFSTPFAGTFDALFRAHVRAAWTALGRPIPAELDSPISRQARTPVLPPTTSICPTLEVAPSWARWAGAGSVRFSQGGAMGPAGAHALGLRYGWSDAGELWLWFELADPAPAEAPGTRLRITAGTALVELPYEGSRSDLKTLEFARGSAALVVRVPPAAQPANIPVQLTIVRRDAPSTPYPSDGPVQLTRPTDPQLAYWSA